MASYPMVYVDKQQQQQQHLLQLDNFYLTAEELQNSPSRLSGVSTEEERQLRIYGCEIIQEATTLLKAPQAVAATGQVLLHRFYSKHSLVEVDVKAAAAACCILADKLELTQLQGVQISANGMPRLLSLVLQAAAAACCFLAGKLEENQLHARYLLLVFDRIERRREGKSLRILDFYSQTYARLKNQLYQLERMALNAFGFITHVDHPHKFVLNYLQLLGLNDKALLQEAWSLSNDSLRTTLCVQYKCEVVACGIIFLAARRLKVALPEDPPWWTVFHVKKPDLIEVACEVHSLYQLPKAAYIPLSNEAKKHHASPTSTRAPSEAAEAPVGGHAGGGADTAATQAAVDEEAAPQAVLANGAGSREPEGGVQEQAPSGRLQQDSPRASRGRDHSPDSPSSSSQRGSLGRSRDADWERRARQRSRSHHRTTDSYLDPRDVRMGPREDRDYRRRDHSPDADSRARRTDRARHRDRRHDHQPGDQRRRHDDRRDRDRDRDRDRHRDYGRR